MADTTTGSTLGWLKFAADLYQSQKKGSYKPVPQTPQQTDLYNFARAKVGALPDVNKALYPTAINNALSSPSLDMDKLRAGAPGAYTAPQRMPFDQNTLATVLAGTAPQPAPQSPGIGVHAEASGVPAKNAPFNRNFVSDTPGGPGQPTMPEYDPNRNVGATPGGINTLDPTRGGTQMPSGMQAADWSAVVAAIQPYGKGALELAGAIATSSPTLGIKGIIDIVRAYYGSHSGQPAPPVHGGGGVVGSPGEAGWTPPGGQP